MEIVERGAGGPHIRQQFHNGILGNSRHAAGRPDRAAFNQAANHS